MWTTEWYPLASDKKNQIVIILKLNSNLYMAEPHGSAKYRGFLIREKCHT